MSSPTIVMQSMPGLCDLPGEIQDQIILDLHPSAAVALSQTTQHFQSIVSLNRLDPGTVDAFVNERKPQINRKEGYLCGSCFRLRL